MPRQAVTGIEPAGHVRIGYVRASTVRQSLDTQLDALQAAGVTRVFSEKISPRATTRPELDKAVTLARELRSAGVAVTLVVHEHKRLGRTPPLPPSCACCANATKPPQCPRSRGEPPVLISCRALLQHGLSRGSPDTPGARGCPAPAAPGRVFACVSRPTADAD